MRGIGRLFSLGVVWAAACADHTFDMLPNEKPAPLPTSAAGADTAGNSGTSGRGGAAGKPAAAGRGGVGGVSGRGGAGGVPISGKGGRGSGGTGLVGEGGSGDEPVCLYSGCCAPNVQGCYPCQHDAECPDHEVCSLTHGCVACRSPQECPNRAGCDDCPTDQAVAERCDYKTLTCKPDCSHDRPCPAGLTCDDGREVCLACLSTNQCPNGLFCSISGECLECLSSAYCSDPGRPVCNVDSGFCRGCLDTSECNAPGTPANFYRTCDVRSGACLSMSSQP